MEQDKLQGDIEKLLRKAMDPVKRALGEDFDRATELLEEGDLGTALETFLESLDKNEIALPESSEKFLAKIAEKLGL